MKSIEVELPDKLADELNRLIEAGWFQNQEEAVRAAVLEFVRKSRVELVERFQREDIQWALAQREASDA
ncbi:MAG: ribbon-helix-helix protein, CopG family [Pyrinomonadaceae bacterium]|nr:ribbon-helix-helix protein, CopG family [Pyrinomonadaceae bacterium]